VLTDINSKLDNDLRGNGFQITHISGIKPHQSRAQQQMKMCMGEKMILPLGHPAKTQYCETLYIFSSISTKLNLPSLALSMKLSSKYSLAASCKVLFILYN
jgi:hypothetical protein